MAFGINDKNEDSLGAMLTAWDLGITHWDTDHACFIGFSEAKKTGDVVLSNSTTSVDHISFLFTILKTDQKLYRCIYFDKDNSLIISKQGDKLYGQLVGNLPRRVHPIDEDTFSYNVLNTTITFKKDAREKSLAINSLKKTVCKSR